MGKLGKSKGFDKKKCMRCGLDCVYGATARKERTGDKKYAYSQSNCPKQ